MDTSNEHEKTNQVLPKQNVYGPIETQSGPGLTRFCILCGIIAAIAPFQFGYKMAELNNPKESIINCSTASSTSDFNWSFPKCLPMSEDYFALATSIFALGGLLGSFFAGYLSDRFGRKKILLFNSLIFFVGATIQAFSLKSSVLIFGRFVSGISSGTAIVVTPIYLTEIAPIQSRGTLNLFNQMSIVIGVLMAQIIGYAFGTGNRWRMVFIISMLLSLVNFATSFFLVESPKHLYQKGKSDEAESILKRLRGTNDVKQELESWKINSENNIISPDSEERLGMDNGAHTASPDTVNYTPEKNINLFSIFGIPKYRQPLFLVFCLQLGQQFSGVNSVIFYSTSILSDIYSKETSSKLTLILGSVSVFSTIFAVIIVDKVERKKLLLSSIIGMFLSMLIFVIALFKEINVLVVVGLFMVLASFAPGYGTLPFLISTELFDTKAVGAGNSVSIATNWIGTFIIGVTFFAIQKAIGYYVFVVYMGFMAIFAAIYMIYLPETKNKSFQVVSKEFVF
ncbi:hypothetical protein BB561_003235 [Smittium simulii]|uniref:Major facilitator superfamily (MFS) profile domain-containing protein n=1 Tax=Smittium simulii TaxID=133385 RepID=A0A2T9YMD9_9FUNG|nr:hypothetical protein BB561_003235 [Smittium simulii]